MQYEKQQHVQEARRSNSPKITSQKRFKPITQESPNVKEKKRKTPQQSHNENACMEFNKISE